MVEKKLYDPKEYEENYIAYMRDNSKYNHEIPPVVSKEKPTLEMYDVTQELLAKNEEKRRLRKHRQNLILGCIFGFILLVVICAMIHSISFASFSSFIFSLIKSILGIFWAVFMSAVFFVSIDSVLNKDYKTDIDKRLEKYNKHLEAWIYWHKLYPQKKVVSYWQKLSGYKFEKELAQIFIKNGFDTEITKKSGDGGVDIILNPKGKKIYIQCKAYQSHAGVAVVRELLGCMELNDVEYGIIACTGGFTKGAVEMAMKVGIYLLDSRDIVALMNMDIPQDYFYRKA